MYSDTGYSNIIHNRAERRGMTALEGSYSLLASIIGGGIVGLPFFFYNAGVPFGIVLCLFSGWLNIRSAQLYLSAKDLIPGNLESLYDIGYATLGKSAIYIVALITTILLNGVLVIY